MPRAVSPWTWRRALRDRWSGSASTMLTLYVIGTYMDRDGYAFPGQPVIAQGARTTTRTVQRHIAAARALGWLSVANAGRGGQGWHHNAYRCCIPDDIEITDTDEELADVYAAQHGVTEGDDTIVSHASMNGHDTIVSSRSAEPGKGDDTGRLKETTSGAEGDDTGRQKVTTQLCRTNSRLETPALEVLRRSAPVGALTPPEYEKRFGTKTPDPEAAQRDTLRRITVALRTFGDRSDHEIASMIAGATPDQVREARTP